MRARLPVLGAALGTLACSAAHAQQAAPPPNIQPTRQYDFGASVSTTYDDNVARSSRALAATRGIDPKEWITKPQVDASIVQPFGRQAIFINGTAGYDFRSKNKQLEHARADVTGGVVAQLGICHPMLYAGYKAQQSDLATIDSGPTKNLVQATTTSAIVECSRGIGPGLQVLADRTDLKNSARDLKVSDSTVESLTLGLNYANPTLGKFGLVYRYSNNEFPNRIIPGRPVGDGFWTVSYGLRAERNLGTRLTVSANVGRTHVKREFVPPGSGVGLTFNSTTYGGDLTYRVGTRITILASASRAVKPSTRPGKLYDLATDGSLSGTYNLGSRFVLGLGHDIKDVKSNIDTLAVPTAPTSNLVLTRARTNSTHGSIEFKPNKKLSLNLELRRDDRKTDVPDLNYKANLVTLSAKFSY